MNFFHKKIQTSQNSLNLVIELYWDMQKDMKSKKTMPSTTGEIFLPPPYYLVLIAHEFKEN